MITRTQFLGDRSAFHLFSSLLYVEMISMTGNIRQPIHIFFVMSTVLSSISTCTTKTFI
jgi:hypothetical protein